MTAIRSILFASAAAIGLLIAFHALASDLSADRRPQQVPQTAGSASARPAAERLACTCSMK